MTHYSDFSNSLSDFARGVFVTVCVSLLTGDDVQSDQAGYQHGQIELSDDPFEGHKPAGRPSQREP
jgi:hypothetical protein